MEERSRKFEAWSSPRKRHGAEVGGCPSNKRPVPGALVKVENRCLRIRAELQVPVAKEKASPGAADEKAVTCCRSNLNPAATGAIVASIYPTDPVEEAFKKSQGRSVTATAVPQKRGSYRSAHLCGVPGLLFAYHTATLAAGPGSRLTPRSVLDKFPCRADEGYVSARIHTTRSPQVLRHGRTGKSQLFLSWPLPGNRSFNSS